MKQPTYEDLWLLAFIDNKTQCFNKNYFDYYIRRNNEYKDCSVIVGELEDLKKIGLGFTFYVDGKFFIVTGYDVNLKEETKCKVYKKFRVDSWSSVLKRVLK